MINADTNKFQIFEDVKTQVAFPLHLCLYWPVARTLCVAEGQKRQEKANYISSRETVSWGQRSFVGGP